ncbi:hypothetical protein [Streptomyces aidingensis]|uniref:Uncharacterized protein n=1 Tax=Streptomyces aidingensis TaxID=910347 RepID=A0A1I1QH56_9ACTN|nr:hypothetical protein [Streptomyces aidingensis]SFD21347.1 hypothetical protein SAMN05421773_111104 [Streptomyces aidingensis]
MPGDAGAHTSGPSGDAWYEARAAAFALRDQLTAAGLHRSFPFLQADVNVFGHGFVNVGRTNPAAAQRLADLLKAARDAMGETAFADFRHESSQ